MKLSLACITATAVSVLTCAGILGLASVVFPPGTDSPARPTTSRARLGDAATQCDDHDHLETRRDIDTGRDRTLPIPKSSNCEFRLKPVVASELSAGRPRFATTVERDSASERSAVGPVQKPTERTLPITLVDTRSSVTDEPPAFDDQFLTQAESLGSPSGQSGQQRADSTDSSTDFARAMATTENREPVDLASGSYLQEEPNPGDDTEFYDLSGSAPGTGAQRVARQPAAVSERQAREHREWLRSLNGSESTPKPGQVKQTEQAGQAEQVKRTPARPVAGKAAPPVEQKPRPSGNPSSPELVARPLATASSGTTKQPAGPARTVASTQTEPRIVGWPLPKTLVLDLRHLARYQPTSEWARATEQAYVDLNELELRDARSLALIEYCEQLSNQLSDYSDQLFLSSPQHVESCTYMTRVAYRMKRRAEIWKQVHQVASRQPGETADADGSVLADQVSRRAREINFEQLDPQWSGYLMLQQARDIFASPQSNPAKHRAIARKILARVTSVSLTPEQTQYAQKLIGNELGKVLREVAVGNLELGRFLTVLESCEERPGVASNVRLNSYFQNYYWHQDDGVQQIAELLDSHYRGSNVRIELSQQMINRMIPREAQTFNQPVKDRILGARVLGQSRISNEISVQLVPHPGHLGFRLQSNGRIFSNTRAHARGFVFSNIGNARVQASKTIAIGEHGVEVLPTDVQASSQQRLTDIQSQLDGVPVVGWLARRAAHNQQQAQGLQAKQIVETKMQNEFRSRVDKEIEMHVNQAGQWIRTNVLDPLHTMELEPSVVRLQTTNEAAIVRYRLAALDQNAADTPRPVSQPGSLVSFQLHRSAINNMLNRIHINSRKFTPHQFVDHLKELLGGSDLKIPGDEHRDVSFEFAGRDALQVDFADHRVAISLRLKKLQIGKRNRWKNLVVTAHYVPHASGTRVFMVFDEEKGLRVTGHKLKLADQLVVRTVFSTLFQPEFDFPLLPPQLATHHALQGLGVSRLVLSDGWLGVSLGQVPYSQQSNLPRQHAPGNLAPPHRQTSRGAAQVPQTSQRRTMFQPRRWR